MDPGRVFTPFDFLDLGSPHSVGMALMRLVRAGSLLWPAQSWSALPMLAESGIAMPRLAGASGHQNSRSWLASGAMVFSAP